MSVASHVMKERLIKEVKKLPEERPGEVLDFVDFLLSYGIVTP